LARHEILKPATPAQGLNAPASETCIKIAKELGVADWEFQYEECLLWVKEQNKKGLCDRNPGGRGYYH